MTPSERQKEAERLGDAVFERIKAIKRELPRMKDRADEADRAARSARDEHEKHEKELAQLIAAHTLILRGEADIQRHPDEADMAIVKVTRETDEMAPVRKKLAHSGSNAFKLGPLAVGGA